MADLLLLFDSGWFGQQPRQEENEPEADAPRAQPHMRRSLVGSMTDLAGVADVGGSEATMAGGRERRRHGGELSQAPKLMRHSGRPPQQQNGFHPEEHDGVLGTWAGRQCIFSDHLRADSQRTQGATAAATAAAADDQQERHLHSPAQQREESPGEDGPVVLRPTCLRPVAEAGASRGMSPPMPAPLPGGRGAQHAAARPDAESLDQELNAVWRWRFTRKWQAEQLAAIDAAAAPGGGEPDDEEEWSAALRMMQTFDGGLAMQIGRTLSLQNSSMIDGGSSAGLDQSLTLMSPGLSQYMLLDGSVREGSGQSPLREQASDATSQIVSVARKAQHLRKHQQEIERQVNERWEAASGGSQWVAQHLPAVQIDSWSAFPFVLVRLGEQRSQRQKLLVRGRNGCTEHQAFAAAEQEATRAAIAHRLPGPRVDLVAAGRMEWVAAPAGGGQGQRRTLRIRASRLLPPASKDARLHSLAGASGVVAELTRASFPQADFDIVAADRAVPAAAAKQ